MEQNRPKVMIFCDFYYPSRNSGGGMWTVYNLVNRLHDRFEFHIVTRNYDNRNDKTPFATVKTDEWNEVGNAKVFYFSALSQRRAEALVEERAPDLIFLNSAFSTPTLKVLYSRKRGRLGNIPVVLAPCGELSPGAMSIKPRKKAAFIGAAKAVGLYNGITWKASFEAEAAEIRSVFGERAEVLIAPDLTPEEILPKFDFHQKPVKTAGAVRFIFLSRLARKKNLLFLLERLASVNSGSVQLEIVGPVEDSDYWAECRSAIARLPANISVKVAGPVSNDAALELLISSHFFVSSTLGENFGYVFIEALAAGCPLLISDRTVWQDVEDKEAGWRVPLENPAEWDRKIRECIDMDPQTYTKMSAAAREYALTWLEDPAVPDATAAVFESALQKHKG